MASPMVMRRPSTTAASPMTDQNGAFGRLHRGLQSNEEVDWKEPGAKPVPNPPLVRRNSFQRQRPSLMNGEEVLTSVGSMTTGSRSHDNNNQSGESPLLTAKANQILGRNTWTQDLDKDFVKLSTSDLDRAPDRKGEEERSEVAVVEQSVFHLTETEKYILKQIMNLTHDRVGLQAHRMLAETHLIRVQTHMEDAQPSEIAVGGYVHLPNRTKMKRHYMKKLGRKAQKSEVQVPKECCSPIGKEVKYDPKKRRHDLKHTITPLVPGSLPDPDFRFRHTFVVDMAYMEKNKVDLTDDRIPVYSAAHPEDKYLLSKEISSEVKDRSKRLLAGIRIAFNNRLYWKDVLKGKSKPSAVLEEGETEELYRKECELFVSRPLSCRSVVYYIDVFDSTQEYGCPSQGYVGVLETPPRALATREGETLSERIMSHIYNDSCLLETTLSLPRLWRHNFYNGVAGSEGVIDQAPSVLIMPLDFGLAGGQVKSKQTDRLRYLEARYMKYFGGVSPVTLNEQNPAN